MAKYYDEETGVNHRSKANWRVYGKKKDDKPLYTLSGSDMRGVDYLFVLFYVIAFIGVGLITKSVIWGSISMVILVMVHLVFHFIQKNKEEEKEESKE